MTAQFVRAVLDHWPDDRALVAQRCFSMTAAQLEMALSDFTGRVIPCQFHHCEDDGTCTGVSLSEIWDQARQWVERLKKSPDFTGFACVRKEQAPGGPFLSDYTLPASMANGKMAEILREEFKKEGLFTATPQWSGGGKPSGGSYGPDAE